MLYLVPHFLNRPFALLALITSISATSLLAISIDTAFYSPPFSLYKFIRNPTITPLNSFLYNASTENLSHHGLHPRYQHFVASLPLLIGPALPLLFNSPRTNSLPFISAVSGTVFLSLIPHQEPRFLLPIIPLVLSSVQLPRTKNLTQTFLAAWVIFNIFLGALMGIYHQGGVVPAQIWLGKQGESLGLEEVLWWRTYSPPVWLLGGNNITTTDLMGLPFEQLMERIDTSVGGCSVPRKSIGLVAPRSSLELDPWTQGRRDLVFGEMWRYTRHLNLDDLDIGEEGISRTLRRVIGRRGLVIWNAQRRCDT